MDSRLPSVNIVSTLGLFCAFIFIYISHGFLGVTYVSSLSYVSLFVLFFIFIFFLKSYEYPLWTIWVLMYFFYFVIPFFSIDQYIFDKLAKFIIATIGGLLLSLFVFNNFINLKFYVYCTILAALTNFIAILLKINTGPMTGFGRYSGLTGNPNTLAIDSICPLFFIFLKPKYFSKYIKLFSVFISFLSVYLTGSRKGLFLFIVLAFMYFIDVLNLSVITISIILSIFIFSLFLFKYFIIELLVQYKYSFVVIDRVLRIFEDNDASFDGRMNLLQKGKEIFIESPLFGNGLAQFEVLSGYGVYSHNNYVEVAVSGGILGLILYYGLYLFVFYNLFKNHILNKFRYFIVIISILIIDLAVVSIYSKTQFLFLMLLLCSTKLNYELLNAKK